MNYKDLTKEYIEEQLYKNNKTLNSLARELNIKIPTLRWKAKKLGVKTRSVSETNRFLFEKQITREQLKDLYINQKKTLEEISKILNCSEATLCNRLKDFGIKARTDYPRWNEGLDISDKRIKKATRKRVKTIKKLYSEGKIKPWNKDLKASEDSRLQYLVETAKKLHEKYDFKGEGNPFYNKKHKEEWKKEQSLRKGGTGIPYEFDSYGSEFTEELKETIRNRDGRKCQMCGCDEKDCYRSLDVHHIDYDKKNCNPSNLISLCSSCHLQTNYEREYWKIVFNKEFMISRRESALHDNEL